MLRPGLNPVWSVSGGQVVRVKFGWKRAALRWTILPRILAGRFPAGARAPKETRPMTAPESPEAGVGHLRACAERFAAGIGKADSAACLTHPYYARLEGLQILRFLAAHARHHQRQLPASPPG